MTISDLWSLRWQEDSKGGGYQVHLEDTWPYFSDHCVHKQPLLPGAFLITLVSKAALTHFGSHLRVLEDVAWLRPVFATQNPILLLLRLQVIGEGMANFWLHHGNQCVALGRFSCVRPHAETLAVALPLEGQSNALSEEHFTQGDIYAAFSDMGIDYGPYFRRIRYVRRHHKQAIARLVSDQGIFLESTNLIDCAFQAGMAISIGEHRDSLMPYSLGRFVWHRPFELQPLVHALVATEKHSDFRTALTLYDEDSQKTPVISVFDLGVKGSR